MREIGKFCQIYCHQAHKRWPKLLIQIESFLNGTISDSTGYTPVELMWDEPRPELFWEILSKTADELPPTESHQNKVYKAYLRKKERAAKRNRRQRAGRVRWDPHVKDLVLAKC
jgi:hypothetical protein